MPAAVETMAYTGEVPWHGVGKPVPQDVTPEEMRHAAGLDWRVEMQDLTYTWDGETKPVDRRVMYRSDTGKILDIIGPRYVPVQNDEVLAFFEEYVKVGSMHLETAGALHQGKWVWALAKMNEGFSLRGDDRVEGYLLLANPHLYGKGMVVKFTKVRVVCWNTMTQALNTEGESLKLWHVREFNEEARREAKERLGLAREALATAETEARLLAGTKIKDEDVLPLVSRIYGFDEEDTVLMVKDEKKQPREIRRTIELFQGAGKGAALPSADGTAWGVLNAVTQFTDWEYGRTVDRRLERSWFGAGESLKRRAQRVLLEHAEK